MIDLHIHSTASDGENTPKELLIKCEQLKLEMICISDHYTMLGYDEIRDPAVRSLFSGEILPGCEFSATFKGIGIEILGYGIDPDRARDYLAEKYPPLAKKQQLELEQLILQYRERGFRFDEEAVRKNAAEFPGRSAMQMELAKYPENVERYLDPESATNGKYFLRKELSNPESPYFFNYEWAYPPAKEICDFIHSMGGKAIVAHPGVYNSAVYDHLEELIDDASPDGLEAWYSTHTPEQREYLLGLCRKYGLIYSGGSDYHNEKREKTGNRLGMAELDGLFPVGEIRKWTDSLLKL